MTTPEQPPRFNPQQYGYGQPVPPQQPPQRPQAWQTGPQQAVPQQGGPGQGGPGQPGGPGGQGPGGQGGPVVRRKGFFGALLDTRFDAMVTPMLIRGFYLLSLAVISIISIMLFLALWGLDGSDGSGTFLVIAVIVTPVFWVFQVVLVRMALEFVINQFKITEELQKIRRQTGGS